jgi:hypothetical protein
MIIVSSLTYTSSLLASAVAERWRSSCCYHGETIFLENICSWAFSSIVQVHFNQKRSIRNRYRIRRSRAWTWLVAFRKGSSSGERCLTHLDEWIWRRENLPIAKMEQPTERKTLRQQSHDDSHRTRRTRNQILDLPIFIEYTLVAHVHQSM